MIIGIHMGIGRMPPRRLRPIFQQVARNLPQIDGWPQD